MGNGRDRVRNSTLVRVPRHLVLCPGDHRCYIVSSSPLDAGIRGEGAPKAAHGQFKLEMLAEHEEVYVQSILASSSTPQAFVAAYQPHQQPCHSC